MLSGFTQLLVLSRFLDFFYQFILILGTRYIACYDTDLGQSSSNFTWCPAPLSLTLEDWQAIIILLAHFMIFLLLWLGLHLFYKSFGG